MAAFARLLTAQNLELETREIEPSASLTNSDEWNFDPLMVSLSNHSFYCLMPNACSLFLTIASCLVPNA
jgi:hypothetical protein